MTNKAYDHMVKKATPSSPTYKNLPSAFVIGGIICTVGQVFVEVYQNYFDLPLKTALTLGSVTLIFLSALLTALGLYDKIAKHGGAGTLVPITGFANAVAAPAIEFKSEGYILGIGAKMFIIAGPVIVYGTLASIVYGLILFLFQLY